MTPDQFLASLDKNGAAPVYLFLGPEPYQRERCRRALLDAVLGTEPEDRESGLTRVDLSEVPLAAALDDARALSLFASMKTVRPLSPVSASKMPLLLASLKTVPLMDGPWPVPRRVKSKVLSLESLVAKEIVWLITPGPVGVKRTENVVDSPTASFIVGSYEETTENGPDNEMELSDNGSVP